MSLGVLPSTFPDFLMRAYEIDGLRAVLEPAIPRATRFLQGTVGAFDGRNHPGRRPRLERPELGRMNQRSTFQAPDWVGINVLCFSLQSKGTM